MFSECQEIPYYEKSHTLQKPCKVLLDVSEKISDLIQRRLAELNISKAGLAKKIGVSRTYIGDLANGTAKTQSGFYRPKPEVLKKLADVLKIEENELLDAIGYSTQNTPALPDGLKPTDFDGLDNTELKEIINFIGYIRFKKLQKTPSKPLKDGDILNVDNGNILRKVL